MSASEPKHTAFHGVQEELGATWTEWEGWSWADHFGDPVAEHQATRQALNLWDESPLRKWVLRGPDALTLCDVLFANDMSTLADGQVRYGAVCDERGKMLADGTVFKYSEDHCLSVTSYDADLEHFRRVAADRGLEVEVEDETPAMPHLQVQGPLARDVLAPLVQGTDLAALRYFRFVGDGVTVAGVPCMISRTGYSGELGYEIYCAPDGAADLWRAVHEAGKPHGMLPIGLAAIETIRVECGLLFPDVDYFVGQTDPFEVSLDFVTKPDKPADFVGKEALQRIAREGSARKLTTLRIQGDTVPEYGAGVTLDGRDVGIVRSPAQSPTFDMEVLGMAAIDRDLVREGQELEVALGDGTVPATVGSFPLYDPEKKRPRV